MLVPPARDARLRQGARHERLSVRRPVRAPQPRAGSRADPGGGRGGGEGDGLGLRPVAASRRRAGLHRDAERDRPGRRVEAGRLPASGARRSATRRRRRRRASTAGRRCSPIRSPISRSSTATRSEPREQQEHLEHRRPAHQPRRSTAWSASGTSTRWPTTGRELNRYLVGKGYLVPFGHRLRGTFVSERIDFENCTVFHPIYLEDFSRFCLKEGEG